MVEASYSICRNLANVAAPRPIRLTSAHVGSNAGDMLQLRGAHVSLVLCCLLAAAACGDDGASGGSGGGGGGAGAGASTGPGAGTGLASVDPGSPNNPDEGCLEGFTACGDVCADLTNDYRHCGGCDASCALADTVEVTTYCVEGACVPVPCEEPGCYCTSATCDGECRTNLFRDADNCGGCDNQCAADELCADSRCFASGGRGTSCDDPLLLNPEDVEAVGFRWSEGLASDHVFVCGPLESVPTRWFRVTVQDDRLSLKLQTDAGDDYIVEVFDAATCDETASVACSDGETGDDVRLGLDIDEGSTFWIAVGLKNESSGEAAILDVED